MPTATAREYPILFRPELVRKILSGSKTQTRRPLRPQPYEGAEIECGWYEPMVVGRDGYERPGKTIFGADDLDGEYGIKFPFGGPGSVLWVREQWCDFCPIWDGRWCGCGSKEMQAKTHKVAYKATPTGIDHTTKSGKKFKNVLPVKWKPSVHMPRWACRLRLEITDVRVERIQSVSEADAIAEGYDYREHFICSWERTYGESWNYDEWVWAISFKVL